MRFFWNSVGVEGNPKSKFEAAGAGAEVEGMAIWRSADFWRRCAASGAAG